MRRALLLAGLVTGVALALGCSSVAYTPVTPATFANAAPRFVTFDALVRRAGALGYEFVAIYPQASSFAVHSRVMGRRGRRARRARTQSLAALRRPRTDVLVVAVGDTAVQVFALGPHVRGETMHPSLAQELGIFAEGMRRGVPMPMGAPMAGPPVMGPAPAPSAAAPAPAPVAPAPAAPSETLTAP